MDAQAVRSLLQAAEDQAMEAAKHGDCPLSASLLKDAERLARAAVIMAKLVRLEMLRKLEEQDKRR